MATISSPRAKLARVVNLAVYEDGSWKIISDLGPAEIKAQLDMAHVEVTNVLERRAAGEVDDDDEDEPGVVATVVPPAPQPQAVRDAQPEPVAVGHLPSEKHY